MTMALVRGVNLLFNSSGDNSHSALDVDGPLPSLYKYTASIILNKHSDLGSNKSTQIIHTGLRGT